MPRKPPSARKTSPAAETPPGPRGPGERAGLEPGSILRAAHALARKQGVSAVSMRRLAKALGVAPNALYSHFPDKAALLDALLDHLLSEVTVPSSNPPAGAAARREHDGLRTSGEGAWATWQEGLADILRQTRQVLLGHAELIPLYLARPGRGPQAARLGEAMLALLAQAGLRDRPAAEALRVLLIFTLGFAAHEAPRRADPTGQERIRESTRAFRQNPEHPHLHSLADELARHADHRTFETGLRWLLASIAQEAAPAVGNPRLTS